MSTCIPPRVFRHKCSPQQVSHHEPSFVQLSLDEPSTWNYNRRPSPCSHGRFTGPTWNSTRVGQTPHPEHGFSPEQWAIIKRAARQECLGFLTVNPWTDEADEGILAALERYGNQIDRRGVDWRSDPKYLEVVRFHYLRGSSISRCVMSDKGSDPRDRVLAQ